MNIELPASEFSILRQDAAETHVYDKVVDKIYIYVVNEKRWVFPRGSRTDVIFKLTGFDMEGGE